jgi:uncharacterized protein
MDEFEWDEAKATSNLEKHGIDFEDAIGIFEGPVLEVRSDRQGEERWKAIGTAEGVELAVIYTVREGRRRIISARRAATNEREAYHQTKPDQQTEGQDRLGAREAHGREGDRAGS